MASQAIPTPIMTIPVITFCRSLIRIEAEMWEREQEKRRRREDQDRKLREAVARIKFE
jgi:hypothetical protein